MKLCIVGQGQLAQVTAICCEPYHERVQPKDAEVLWVCYDTPLKVNHEPETNWVIGQVSQVLYGLSPLKVLLSSPVPVGTTAELERLWPTHTWVYSPENIRVAHGVEDFMHQARIVVGRRGPVGRLANDSTWHTLLRPFTNEFIWTDPETAEMSKHALNAYLAMNIAFANEIGRLCGAVGADAQMVAHALLTERRVSPEAPLRPGEPFGGGHLSRDLWCLENISSQHETIIPIISSIEASNQCATAPTTPPTSK